MIASANFRADFAVITLFSKVILNGIFIICIVFTFPYTKQINISSIYNAQISLSLKYTTHSNLLQKKTPYSGANRSIVNALFE